MRKRLSKESQRAHTDIFSHDRRQFLRRRLKSLAYVDLGNDSGGIVLNMSEGGLALHSAVVLARRPLPPIRFQLPDSSDWVTTRAEITWINATRKQAGIAFSALPDDARGHIRKWVSSPEDDSANSAAGPMKLVALNPREVPAGSRTFGRRATDQLDRLHLHLPTRDRAARASQARRGQGLWWSLVATVGLLAIVSFAFGWIAGRSKLNRVPAALAKMAAARMVAHAQHAGASARRSTAAANDASTNSAPSPTADSAALSPRVAVSATTYVPVGVARHSNHPRVRTLQMGRLDQRINPHYPPQALSRRIEGTVRLHATIAADGRVAGIAVLDGPSLLIPAAEAALRARRYSPTLLDGKPVPVDQDVTLTFSLPQAR